MKVVYFIESISCLLIININIFTNSNRQKLEILNLCISTCVHLHKIYQKTPQIQRHKINKNGCDIWGNDCLIAHSVKWCRVHFFDPHYMYSVMSENELEIRSWQLDKVTHPEKTVAMQFLKFCIQGKSINFKASLIFFLFSLARIAIYLTHKYFYY